MYFSKINALHMLQCTKKTNICKVGDDFPVWRFSNMLRILRKLLDVVGLGTTWHPSARVGYAYFQ